MTPERWAISYDQLMGANQDFMALCEQKGQNYLTMTMRDVNEMLIKPKCAESRTSYAVACNPNGLKLNMFVTHAWDELFAEFIESIQSACAHDVIKPNLWICAFALVQSDDPSIITAQVGDEKTPLDQAPFVQALKHAGQFLVVRNSNTDIYARLWCGCELIHAITNMLP